MNLLQGHFAGFHRSSEGSLMISLMMQHLLPLGTLLLLSIIPTETEVVASVAQCNEFFLAQTPPNIPGILEGGNIKDQNRYKVICQTLRNIRRFVTLYDTQNRIPVFSAAEYRGGGEGREPLWKIEPQLENPTSDANMTPAENIIYTHQAGDIDYSNLGQFEKGHLFPSSYRSEEGDKRSTFTLTNAVPQRKLFNNGRWNSMERCVKCILDKYCINNKKQREGFVVIGAQPSSRFFLNNRINIPSVLWSAFCCYSQSQNSWLASAHWGENKDLGPKYLETKTLGELHTELGIEAFPGTKCPNDESVTQLYSEPACKSHCRQ
ncbi:endonuclease domain-containing 1 protein-like isoform X2 [Simochromis diagramma]|uniref:endonuclease domain-containing 1 protein-like isoform X2 n=1 Tax=Simochromis diagramma TaxID=43689 RepID=UPI001A7EF84B|nr:endonuclease domain-containing 1 protein-like isoform X2 [Simochromis diagramma]